ncbi:MAG: hypothetical protein WDO70_05260 [Alphaproteobacteria bacterium]
MAKDEVNLFDTVDAVIARDGRDDDRLAALGILQQALIASRNANPAPAYIDPLGEYVIDKLTPYIANRENNLEFRQIALETVLAVAESGAHMTSRAMAVDIADLIIKREPTIATPALTDKILSVITGDSYPFPVCDSVVRTFRTLSECPNAISPKHVEHLTTIATSDDSVRDDSPHIISSALMMIGMATASMPPASIPPVKQKIACLSSRQVVSREFDEAYRILLRLLPDDEGRRENISTPSVPEKYPPVVSDPPAAAKPASEPPVRMVAAAASGPQKPRWQRWARGNDPRNDSKW